MCKHIGVVTLNKHYEHETENVIDINDITVLWDISIATDNSWEPSRFSVPQQRRKILPTD